jgi:hypothetical protein
MATSRVSIPGTAAMPEGGLGWVGGWNSSPLLNSFNNWNRPSREEMACLADERPSTELAEARAYLVQTASLTYTTAQQGPEVAIERLHPKFAIRPEFNRSHSALKHPRRKHLETGAAASLSTDGLTAHRDPTDRDANDTEVLRTTNIGTTAL